jgi:hypothetical protein
MTQPSHADLQSDILVLLERVEANGRASREGFAAMDKRLSAIEAKVMAYDLLKARMIGIFSTSVVAIGAAWYWLGDRIESALGK